MDVEKACKWFQKAAEKDHVEAKQCFIGQNYLNGTPEKSSGQAKYWLEKALESEQGSDEQKQLSQDLIRMQNL